MIPIVNREMGHNIIIVDLVETIHRKIDHNSHMVEAKRAMTNTATSKTPSQATAMAAWCEKGRGQVKEITLRTVAYSRVHLHLRGHRTR